MSAIWIVYAEVRGTPKSALSAECGAFVECYTPAASADDAIALARSALQEDGYQVVGETECIRFEEDAWDDENDPEREVRSTVAAASSDQSLHFGTFRAWEP